MRSPRPLLSVTLVLGWLVNLSLVAPEHLHTSHLADGHLHHIVHRHLAQQIAHHHGTSIGTEDDGSVQTLDTAQLDVTQADVLAARRLPNPRVTISREAVAGVAEDFVLVNQALPITGRRGFEIRAAEASLRADELRVADLERRARAELRFAFATLVEQQVRERELATTLTSLRGLADVLAKREQAGDAAGFDRLRAEREVVELEADLVSAQAARREAQGTLAGFFSPPMDPSSVVAGDRLPSGDLLRVDDLIARAESSRADLRALEQEGESARFAQRAAARRLVPEPEVVAGVKTSDARGSNVGSVLSVLASVALFDRAQPERARAVARERQAAASLEAARAQLRAEIAALRTIVDERRRALAAYRQTAISRSDDLSRIAQVSYEAGERSILELLDAYRTSSTARLRLAALEHDLVEAEIRLDLMTGLEPSP